MVDGTADAEDASVDDMGVDEGADGMTSLQRVENERLEKGVDRCWWEASGRQHRWPREAGSWGLQGWPEVEDHQT
jgi:hypothetical protein